MPLDHFAALSKAHHSKSGAVKVMQKHGIDVPKGYSSDHKGSGKPSAPSHADVKSTHPVGATVKASQPGIDNQTHGKVVGHTPTGMVLVSHTGHNGKPLVGTFNPSHTHVVGSGATTHDPHPAPHTLKPGEHATVRGTDEYGQPATYTGKVMANGEVSSFSKGRTTGGQPLRSISVERQDGSRRSNVVYVPDPNRGEQKRGSALEAHRAEVQKSQAEHLRAASVAHGLTKPQPSSGDLTEAAAKWRKDNPGKTIAGHEREVNRIAERLAENKFIGKGTTGDTASQAAAEKDRIRLAAAHANGSPAMAARLLAEKRGKPAATKRVEIEHSGDGTTLSIDRGDTEARDAAKAAGFRWSSNLGAWYLPRTQHESTRRAKVGQLEAKLGKENVHVEDGGHGVTTTAAEREAAKIANAKARAEHMDSKAQKLSAESARRRAASEAITEHIPMGQPILVGHHSQRRHERALERAHSNDRASWEAAKEARSAEAAAERARKTAAGTDPLARQRRVDRNSAELRSIEKKLNEDDVLRKMSPESQAKLNRIAGVKPLDSDYRARLEASRNTLRDDIAHDKSQIEASGIKQVTAADIKAGDMVHYRGRTHIVTKVNKTTVSVPSGYSWDDKVPINQVAKHIPLNTQSDESVKAAFDKTANPKVKAALLTELKRRGLAS